MAIINVSGYLIVKVVLNQNDWVKSGPTLRVTKNKPTLDKDEIAIKLNLELPSSLFKVLQLNAHIVIPESDAPNIITAEVRDNIVNAIQEASGLNVHLTVGENDE